MTLRGYLRQHFAAFSCYMTLMTLGACFMWFAPLMWRLAEEVSGVTAERSSWMVSIIEIGDLVSPIPAGLFINSFGRKGIMMTTIPLLAIGWLIMFLTRNIFVLQGVRLIQGIAVGTAFTVAPIYLVEIAEPTVRGAICGHFQTAWILGSLYSHISGKFLTYDSHLIACSSLTLICVVSFFFAPESPYALLLKGRKDEARRTLMWLYDKEEVEEELTSIEKSLVEEEGSSKVSWKDLVATRKDRRALLVVTSVCFVKYMSGMAAVLCYMSENLSDGGLGDYAPIMITSIMVVTTFFSAFTSDKLGRKPLVLISCVGAVVCNAVVAGYFWLQEQGHPVKDHAWVLYTGLAACCSINSLGLGPLLQTLQGECFPSRTRGRGGALISLLGTAFTFVVLKQYQTISDNIGVSFNYMLFSFFSFLGSIVLFYSMKETAGKSLEEIHDRKMNVNNNETVP